MHRTTPTVHIAVLGPLEVRVDGVRRDIPAAKQRQLLARLVVDAGRVVTNDAIIDALWGERPPATVRKNLNVLVARLRSILEPDRLPGAAPTVLLAEPRGYRLAAERCTIDAIEFEAGVDRATGTASDGVWERAVDELERSCNYWRDDVAVELATAQWAAPFVARLQAVFAQARLGLHSARVELGPSADTLTALERELERHPHREALAELLARAFMRVGRFDDARLVVQAAVMHLGDDLGLDPGPGLQQLFVDLESYPTTGSSVDLDRAIVEAVGRAIGVPALREWAAADGIDEIEMLDGLERCIQRGVLSRSIAVGGDILITPSPSQVQA